MSDLMTGSSSYGVGGIDTTTTLINGVSPRNAEHINGLAAAIIQIETILGSGTTLKGSVADLATRLATVLSNAGLLNNSLVIVTPTITTPAISNPVLSGTLTGTYTLGGIPTIPATVGASWVWIETINMASNPTIINLGSSYDEHLFQLINVVPTVDTADLFLTYSADNGASFANSGYETCVFGVTTAITSAGHLAFDVSNLAVRGGVNGWVHLFSPHQLGVNKRANFTLSYVDPTGVLKDWSGTTRCKDTSPDVVANAVNAIRIDYASGDVATGTLRHYALKNG
jgi:hypothetical protein